ncbi:YecA family protein [Vibrio sp. SBT000027]|uniref:YecA family protein n=1 Tax=Vibrio sp. SBT000027 TaxID=1803384 RepID=UPI00160098D3|nr:SEC-C domain-containing protein [Vibrio sp. SBT000027]
MDIGRNDPCWCGTGKKYKKCHLNKENEEKFSLSRMIAEVDHSRKLKKCLHPEASKTSCSKKIIDAHTIQRNGPLKEVVDSTNHVYAFNQYSTGVFDIAKLGWKKASTFKGFCGKHDKELFSCIEDNPFTGSKEQCVMAGYRANALECFKKIECIKGMPAMKEKLDRGQPKEKQIEIQALLTTMTNGYIKGEQEFRKTLDFYIDKFDASMFHEFESLILEFNGDLGVVVSGCFSPDFTIDGQRLQVIDENIVNVENIAVNTLNTPTGHAVVFTWPRHFEACRAFILSLMEVDPSKLPSHIIELMFGYIENVYFSKVWYDALSNSAKNHITELASTASFYGKHFQFSKHNYVNWTLISKKYN